MVFSLLRYLFLCLCLTLMIGVSYLRTGISFDMPIKQLPWLDHWLQVLKINIQFDQISLHWRHYGIDLQVKELDVSAPDTLFTSTKIGSGYAHIHVWRSLLSAKLVVDELVIHQGELLFTRAAKSQEDSVSEQLWFSKKFYQYLLPIRVAIIKQFKIGVMPKEQQVSWLWLDELEMGLSKQNQYVFASLNPGHGPSDDKMVMQTVFEQDKTGSKNRVGELYFNAKNIDLSTWLNFWLDDTSIISSALNLKASFIFSGEQGPSGEIQFGDTFITLGSQRPHQAYGIEKGQIFLQPTSQGWELYGYHLDFFHNAQVHRDWLLHLEKKDAQIYADLGPIYLELVNATTEFLTLFYPQVAHMLQTITPRGEMKYTRFFFDVKEQRYQLQGEIQHLITSHHNWIPALEDANIVYQFSEKGGLLKYEQQGGEIDFGDHFKKPWSINRGQLVLEWDYETADTDAQIRIPVLFLDSPQIDLKLNGQIQFMLNQLPHMKLYSELSLHDVRDVNNYLPLKIMDPDLVDYLSNAFQAGSFQDAQVIWDGPLGAFPYSGGTGIFLADLDLQQTTFLFSPQWRPLKDLSLNLLFKNDGLSMQAKHAYLDQIQVQHIQAKIPKLGHRSALHLQASAQGNVQDGRDYLVQSPLKKNLEKTLDVLHIEGKFNTDFTLDIPLWGKNQEVDIDGQVTFEDNQVTLPYDDLKFSNVKGILHFEKEKTSISGMKATLNGFDVDISYYGQSLDEKDFNAIINIQGKTNKETLKNLSLAKKLQLSGDFDWHFLLDLKVPEDANYYYKAVLHSDLKGLKSELPSPFDKSEDQRRYTQLQVSGDSKQVDLSGLWDQWLNIDAQVQLNHDAKQAQIMKLSVNGGEPEPSGDLFSIPDVQFKLKQLDVSRWLDIVTAFKAENGQTTNTLLWPETIKLLGEVDTLIVNGQGLKAMHIDANVTPQVVDLDLRAENVLAHVRKYRTKSAPIDIQLEAFDWRFFVTQSTLSSTPKNLDFDALLALPWANVKCKSCQLPYHLTGDLNFEIKPEKAEQMFRLNNIDLQIDGARTKGNAIWRRDQEKVNAQVICDGRIDNIQTFIENLGYRSPVSKADVQWKADLNWHSQSLLPQVETLQGNFDVKTGSGSLVDINEPGTKILSLIDLSSLVKLLKLDFRDVFEKGFFFERITFTGKVQDGVIENDDFLIAGSAGQISGHGKLDFVEEKIDFLLSFTPNLTGSLPIITAFAWNPVAAFSVFAASKLLAPVIDVITRIDYKVKGPLFEPQLKEIRRGKGQVELDVTELDASKKKE